MSRSEKKLKKSLKQERIGQLREQIAEKTALRQQVEQQTTALRQSEKDILVQKEKYTGELLRLEDKKAAVQKEYDAIISQMWDMRQHAPRQRRLSGRRRT